MKCPHCSVTIHDSAFEVGRWNDQKGTTWMMFVMNCPECGEPIIRVKSLKPNNQVKVWPAFPQYSQRQLPTEVQGGYRQDFQEATEVLNVSPKASAALSRRCLQQLLRDEGGFIQKDLAPQIEAAISSGRLPSHLAEAIDGVRNIGNFAAHPLKSEVSGSVVDVESGEAEWLLDTLETLFDYYLVQPAKLKAKRDALNAKLAEHGKPPMK